jgi:predicted GIY-YIG superfamily endonuclease
MEYIYVLGLGGGNFVIGRTADVDRRVEQHRKGQGPSSAWTQKHGVEGLVETRVLGSDFDEGNVTKEYMLKHGIDRVRGGTHSQVVLGADAMRTLEKELGHAQECICGREGHCSGACSTGIGAIGEPPGSSSQSMQVPASAKGEGAPLSPPHPPTIQYIYVLALGGGNFYIGKTGNVDRRVEQHRKGQGPSSAWTRKHGVEGLVETRVRNSDFEEDMVTKEYMLKHGIDRVRGGAYVEIELKPETFSTLQKELWHAQDKCTRCGRDGHFIMSCTATTTVSGEPVGVTSPQRLQAHSAVATERLATEVATQVLHMLHASGAALPAALPLRRLLAASPAQAPARAAAPEWSPRASASTVCTRCGRAGHEGRCDARRGGASAAARAPAADACFRCGRTTHFASECYARTTVGGDRLSDSEDEKEGRGSRRRR